MSISLEKEKKKIEKDKVCVRIYVCLIKCVYMRVGVCIVECV